MAISFEDFSTWHDEEEVTKDLHQFLDILTPDEIAVVRQAFVNGEIDGGSYIAAANTSCGCLKGTAALARGFVPENGSETEGEEIAAFMEYDEWKMGLTYSPIENFILPIDIGDNTQNNIRCQWVVEQIDKYTESRG